MLFIQKERLVVLPIGELNLVYIVLNLLLDHNTFLGPFLVCLLVLITINTCAGNGVTGCTRGDCISLRHEQCPNNKACYDSTCVGK